MLEVVNHLGSAKTHSLCHPAMFIRQRGTALVPDFLCIIYTALSQGKIQAWIKTRVPVGVHAFLSYHHSVFSLKCIETKKKNAILFFHMLLCAPLQGLQLVMDGKL